MTTVGPQQPIRPLRSPATSEIGLTMLIEDTGPMLFTNISTSMTVGFTAGEEEK